MKFLGVFLIVGHLLYDVEAQEAALSRNFVCQCPPTVAPVCGTNNRTYRNNCYLQCASRNRQEQGYPPIYFQYNGACSQEACQCTLELQPVCASDGNTYNNICLLNCQNERRNALGLAPLAIKYQGPCLPCNCTTTDDPVCASDNNSYKNPCYLDCENAARNQAGLPPLTILYKGVCGCNCDPVNDPVCGSDGTTYNNYCLLQCESNRRVLQGLSPIYFQYRGACACTCPNCPGYYQPVCGSDRRTYWNLCSLNCYSDCNVRQGLPPITLVYYGRC